MTKALAPERISVSYQMWVYEGVAEYLGFALAFKRVGTLS